MKLTELSRYSGGIPLAIVVLITCTSCLLASASKTTSSAAKSVVPKAPKVVERTLHCSDRSFGGLYVIPKVQAGLLYGQQELAVAKDTVKLKVPEGYEILLRGNTALLQNPAALDKWAPDTIDVLEIKSALFSIGDEQFGTRVFSHVNKLTGLRILRAAALEPDDIGVSSLKTLKKLEILSINIGKLDGSCLKDLQTLPALTDLDISDNAINLNNLSYLAKFPVLKHLEMHRCKLNKAAIQQISKCSTLEDLNLSGNSLVRDDCCEYLAKLPNLKIMDLQETQITGHGLLQLQGLKKLKEIVITSSFVSPDARVELHKAMPNTAIVLKSSSLTLNKDMNRIFAPLPK
jgi:Leucine-rich repeat (LRR) protein